jgi:sulfur carrier protein ThiS adenylyltransferase
VLKTVRAYIVGVGAIGSQVAKQLAHIGVEVIHIVDFDTVDVENLAVQGFTEADLGKKKVDAVSEACAAINSAVTIKSSTSKFRKVMIEKIEKTDDDRIVIISAVDKMDVRKNIWEAYAEKFKNVANALFVDSRMGAETARILTVRGTEEQPHYEKTLFNEGEGLQQSCTSKSTIYCANIAAGMIVGQFTKWLRGCYPDRDTLFGIFTNQLMYDAENLSS